ncbi:hypothetical protein KCU81_g440, partial [Aureobasidium melanogenum]
MGDAGLLAAGVLRPPNDLRRSGDEGLLELGVFLPGNLFHVCVLNLRMKPGLFSGVAAPLFEKLAHLGGHVVLGTDALLEVVEGLLSLVQKLGARGAASMLAQVADISQKNVLDFVVDVQSQQQGINLTLGRLDEVGEAQSIPSSRRCLYEFSKFFMRVKSAAGCSSACAPPRGRGLRPVPSRLTLTSSSSRRGSRGVMFCLPSSVSRKKSCLLDAELSKVNLLILEVIERALASTSTFRNSASLSSPMIGQYSVELRVSVLIHTIIGPLGR